MTAPACEYPSYHTLDLEPCLKTASVHVLFKNRMTGQESVGSFCDRHWGSMKEELFLVVASWEDIPLEHRLLLDVLLA